MKIREIFDQKTVFSFEVFPSKKTSNIETVYKTLDELKGLTPDFISVTFSAGGSGNILALRGDINPDIPPKNDFKHASELVSYIKARGDYDIAGACYPEVHSDSANMVEDILNLKKKVDAGADHFIR